MLVSKLNMEGNVLRPQSMGMGMGMGIVGLWCLESDRCCSLVGRGAVA